MNCNNNKVFLVANLFNELTTDGEKRIARLNLGVKDSDSLTWGNIGGNIYDLQDLVYFVETLKMLASLTGTVIIFRLNDNTIDRTIEDIPDGWSTSMPDTTSLDKLWMSQANKQGGIYKVGPDGLVWGEPIVINYSNVADAELQEQIDDIVRRLNESFLNQTYLDNLVSSMNQVTVNQDGSISVTGRDGNVSVWQHQDLGNYLLLGNSYGNADGVDSSFFILSKTGLLQAHNALIHGTVYATDGWFAGELRAATGSFTGEITATSGKIGGWKIIDGILMPENIPTTALIGKIQASQVEFGSVLTDLKDNILSDYNGKIKTLGDTLAASIETLSTRFTIGQGSFESSISLIKSTLNQFGSSLLELLDKINKEKNDRIALYYAIESKIQLTADQLTLGIEENLLSYSKKFDDYVTTRTLESKLSLLSNQISAKVSQIDYNENNRLILSKIAELSITPELIASIVENQMSGLISNLIQTADSLQAQITESGNLLSQLGITSDGIIMKGNTLAYYATGNIIDPVFACNADGSGKIAKGTISWDTNGNVTLGSNVVISWNDILDRPQINSDGVLELSIKDIVPIYHKSTSLPSKPVSEASISNLDISNLWTTKIPTIKNDSDFIFKCNRITHSNDEITYTTVEKDEALTIAQRSKNRLDLLFNNGDHQGTQITQEYIYTGAFGAQNAYIMNIQSSTTDPAWALYINGSGYFSKGKLSWDTEGNLTVNGTVHTDAGEIAGWKIYNTYIEGSSEDTRTRVSTKLYKTGGIELNRVIKSNYISSTLDINPVTGLSVYKFDEDDNEITQIALNMDGSGLLASGNLTWDTYGNLTLNGAVNATSGTIGGWEITNLYIQGSLYISNLNSVTGMYDAIKSTTKLYNSGCIEINSKYGYATAESNVQQSMVGITNDAFAGINEDGLYTSRESFTPESHYSTIRQYTNLIKVDGSGLLANNNINWDARGDVTIKFTLSSGNITYDITLDNSGIHYVDQDNPNNSGTLEWTALIDNVS